MFWAKKFFGSVTPKLEVQNEEGSVELQKLLFDGSVKKNHIGKHDLRSIILKNWPTTIAVCHTAISNWIGDVDNNQRCGLGRGHWWSSLITSDSWDACKVQTGLRSSHYVVSQLHCKQAFGPPHYHDTKLSPFFQIVQHADKTACTATIRWRAQQTPLLLLTSGEVPILQYACCSMAG